jgi:hypothetical protein
MDFLLDLLQRLRGTGNEDDVRARAAKGFGGRGANAAAGAGDKRKLAGKWLRRISHGKRL